MSLITDVLVVTLLAETAAIEQVNAHLAATDQRGQQLRPLNMDAAGGTKFSSFRVYAAAFNYVDYPGLRDSLLSAPWTAPEDVFIHVDGEGYWERFSPADAAATPAP
jgi:hypothetical protein